MTVLNYLILPHTGSKLGALMNYETEKFECFSASAAKIRLIFLQVFYYLTPAVPQSWSPSFFASYRVSEINKHIARERERHHTSVKPAVYLHI